MNISQITPLLLGALLTASSHASEIVFRLTKKDGVLQSYYDQPNSFPVTKAGVDYISFASGADLFIHKNGKRLFDTKEATVEVFKGAGKGFQFTGKETVDAIAKYEAVGLTVIYVIIYHEDWLFRNGKGGPWEQDVRILSEKSLKNVRAALKKSSLKSKDSVKIIQLVGARVQKHRGDTWPAISKDPALMAHLENFDGIGVECHTNDHDTARKDDGRQTLDSMALATKWAKDHQKHALIFMGGTAFSYRNAAETRKTYAYLWNRMAKLGVGKKDANLIYFRQGARKGSHLPEAGNTLTSQMKWLIENVGN